MRFSLQTKMLLVTVLVIIGASTFSLYYTNIFSKKILTNEVASYMTKEAVMVKHFVEKWLDYAVDDVVAWGFIPVFADAVTETGYYGQRAIEESEIRLLELFFKYKKFARIYIYDLDGKIIASSSPKIYSKADINISDRHYFKAASFGRSHVSKVITSRYTSDRLFVVSAPIKKEGHIVGVIAGSVSIESMASVLKDIVRLSTNRIIYIVDSKGYPIVSSVGEENKKNQKFLLKINMGSVNFFKKNSYSEEQSYFMDGDIYVSSPIKYNKWKVIEASPLDLVESSVKIVLKYSSVAAFLSLFAIAFILFFIYRINIFSRLMHLQKKIQLLEQGNMDTRIKIDSRKDEISSLIQSFNNMASRLQDSIGSLRSSREQFQVAVDGSNDGIWDWDILNDQLYLSPRWYAQLGYKVGELGPPDFSSFEGLLYKEDLERVKDYTRRFLDGKINEKFDIEFRMCHKDGTIRWIHSRAAMLQDENGRPYRLAGAHTDTTRQHLIAEQLVKAKEGAESSNRYKSEFLANMSHEIRTPIGFITGLCHMMMGTQLDKNQIDYIKKIQISSQSLLSIVNDILDFSKIEAGKLDIDLQFFNLQDLLNFVVESFSSAAYAKRINLAMEFSPDIPESLESDPARLKQVFINIVSNAVKFTEKGKILIKVDCLSKDEKKAKIQIIVSDTGIGMSSEQKDRIFKPFSQADSSIARKFGGTGLGLVISHELLQLLGGDISVKSEQNKGTEFIINIELNIYPFTAKSDNNVSTKLVNDEKKPFDLDAYGVFPDARLLLVEDNQINVMIAENLLATLKIVPDVAQNGQEALDKIKINDYDLILMDVQMPIMDGYTATKKIRALKGGKYQRIPIIAMTANAMKHDIETALSVGMNNHLSKPIEPEAFYRMILKWLDFKPNNL